MVFAASRVDLGTEVHGLLPNAVHPLRPPDVVSAVSAGTRRRPVGHTPVRPGEVEAVVGSRRVDGRSEVPRLRPLAIHFITHPDVHAAHTTRSIAHDVELVAIRRKERFDLEVLGADRCRDNFRGTPLTVDERRRANVISTIRPAVSAVEVHRAAVCAEGRLRVPSGGIQSGTHVHGLDLGTGQWRALGAETVEGQEP